MKYQVHAAKTYADFYYVEANSEKEAEEKLIKALNEGLEKPSNLIESKIDVITNDVPDSTIVDVE